MSEPNLDHEPEPDPLVVFTEALDQGTPEGRVAFLERACAGAPGLRAHVEALLAAHEQVGSFLESPASPPTGVIASQIPGPGPGEILGPYKLLQPIGEGGMGTVFMAEQEHPVRRRVALKLIKPGMDSRQVIARFEAERQALALMDHPNIAKVLDAGTTESGRPYFVMELVKGVPITRYCDENRLTPRQRLELFLPVCQAVQHAHQKGIIHRDLKPSNVVVALYDGQPVPKVIDFGVAKATGPRLTDRTLFTEFGAVVGTLEYMSPEQAELNQLDVDTRSDVYSLGVLLYELLTGTTPLDRERLRESSLLEVLRLIREEEAPRPSMRLSETKELPAIAARRGLEPGKLSRLVRGELDWIVLKALEKDRNRRYVTANSLAMDIRRYLVDEPVLACPPSPLYRFGKFARQNRAALVIAALIGVGLLVTAGTLAVSNRLVTAERDEKIKALGEARTEADKANAINSLLQEMLASANPDSAKGAGYTVRELLDEFSSRLGNQLREQPEVEAAVRVTIGNAYRRLGAYDRAQQELLVALKLWSRVLGTEHPKVAEILVDYAWAVAEKHELDEAVTRTRLALDIYRRQRGPKSGMIRALWTLQQFLLSLGRFDEAEAAAREGLALARAHAREEYPEVASILHCSAQAKIKLGRHAEAEALAREAVALHRRLHGPNHPETGWALLSLGRALRGLDRHTEAEAALRQSLAVFRRYYGSEHKSVAMVLPELTSLLKARGDQAGLEALALENLSLANRRAEQQPNEPEAWLDRAKAHAELGHWNEARADYAKAVSLGADADAELGGQVASADIDHGRALKAANRLPEAEKAFREAQTFCAQLVADHPDNTDYQRLLAATHTELKEYDKAIALLTRAIELKPEAAELWAARGYSRLPAKQFDRAVDDFSKALELNPKIHGAWLHRGHAHLGLSQWERAAADFSRAAELNPKGDGERFYRAEAYFNLRRWDEAIADYSTAIERRPDFAPAWAGRAMVRAKLGQWEQAVADYAKAADVAAGPQRQYFLAQRVGCLARAGEVDAALREADDWVRGGDAIAHYNAACVYALVAGWEGNASRAGAAEDRARRAIELLRQSAAAGFKNALSTVNDDDLDALRDRADFPAVLAEMGQASPQIHAAALAALGTRLLGQRKYAAAERVVRDCLAIREKEAPDAWTAFNARSLLGGALVGCREFAEAEPLLVQGYEGMARRAASIPQHLRNARLAEALERLIQLYEEWDRKDVAAKWRAIRETRTADRATPEK